MTYFCKTQTNKKNNYSTMKKKTQIYEEENKEMTKKIAKSQITCYQISFPTNYNKDHKNGERKERYLYMHL